MTCIICNTDKDNIEPSTIDANNQICTNCVDEQVEKDEAGEG
jgi:hypothetical protein